MLVAYSFALRCRTIAENIKLTDQQKDANQFCRQLLVRCMEDHSFVVCRAKRGCCIYITRLKYIILYILI